MGGNILLVANWPSDVGYAWWLMENFWVAIDRHFSAKGRTCYLIFPHVNTIPIAIRNSNIVVVQHDFTQRSFGAMIRLGRLLRRNNIRFVYLTDKSHYGLIYLYLRCCGVRRIVVHEHAPGERSSPRRWVRAVKITIHLFSYTAPDHFVAVTEYVRNRLVGSGCIPSWRVSCAPNGIEPIDHEDADQAYAWKIFHIPTDSIIVVVVGRASFYKGLDFIVKCAHELVINRRAVQLHFLYCGDGPDLDSFKVMVRERKLEAYFTFAGKRDDIRNILPSCQIGFHASRGEVGYSLAILEQMSAGLTTVVPKRLSVASASTHMKTALVYEPEDVASAADSILHAATDPDLRKRLGVNAALTIQEKYDIRRTNEQLITVLSKVFDVRK